MVSSRLHPRRADSLEGWSCRASARALEAGASHAHDGAPRGGGVGEAIDAVERT